MLKSVAVILAVGFLISACGGEQAAVEPQIEPADAAAVLHEVFEDYFERNLVLNPMRATSIGDDRYNDRFANSLGPEYIEASRVLDEESLARLLEIDPAQLGRQDQLSYDMFRLNRERSLEGHRFPGHLQPINQFSSTLNSFVVLGSGSGRHPFKTVKNYDDWLSRVDGFIVYTDQVIENTKLGMQQGVVRPRILVAKALPQIQSQVVDSAEGSGFYTPITNMPEDFSAADRERLTAAYKEAIEGKIIPAYERLSNFVGDEYLESARETVGHYDLPNGNEWYAYNVKRITTTNLTPDEIHQIGLNEVERIHGEMRGVMEQLGFEGDLKEFFEYVYSDPQFFFEEPEQLIQAYRDMSAEIEALAPQLFNLFPKTAFEVRRVEPFREQSSAKGSYQRGTPDGSRPGIFYANAYNVGSRPKWDMKSLFLHEAIPGHHFQISLAQENEQLPRFRRYGGYTAYVEGWGLYAEAIVRPYLPLEGQLISLQ